MHINCRFRDPLVPQAHDWDRHVLKVWCVKYAKTEGDQADVCYYFKRDNRWWSFWNCAQSVHIVHDLRLLTTTVRTGSGTLGDQPRAVYGDAWPFHAAHFRRGLLMGTQPCAPAPAHQPCHTRLAGGGAADKPC